MVLCMGGGETGDDESSEVRWIGPPFRFGLIINNNNNDKRVEREEGLYGMGIRL